jgi:DNA-binding NarL/FixJ family response regulator
VRGAPSYRLVVRSGSPNAAARAAVLGRRWALTSRQVEVLSLLARGLANKSIAAALGCAEVTVELHVTALLHKFGVDCRAALVARFWTESSP